MLVVRRGAAAQDGERPTPATLGSGRHVVLAVAGSWLLSVLVVWAALQGPAQVLTGPGYVAGDGSATLAPDRALVRLWVLRGLLALVPLGVSLAAVEVLAGEPAPGWLWSGALATVVLLVLVASRATHRVEP